VFQRDGQADRQRHRLRAGSVAALLVAAVEQRAELRAALQQEQADPLRAAELVSRGAERRHPQVAEVHRHPADRLRRVAVQGDVLRQRPGDVPDGLDGARLVIDEHKADEPGVLANSLANGCRLDVAAARDGKPFQLEPAASKLPQRLDHAGVLDRGGEQVAGRGTPPPGPLPASGRGRRLWLPSPLRGGAGGGVVFHQSEDGQVVRLGCPAGEDHLIRVRGQQVRDPLAGVLQVLPGLPAGVVG
jgi:hypothetical protein